MKLYKNNGKPVTKKESIITKTNTGLNTDYYYGTQSFNPCKYRYLYY